QLNRMLVTLHEKGYVVLDPPPLSRDAESAERSAGANDASTKKIVGLDSSAPASAALRSEDSASRLNEPEFRTATPTLALDKLLVFRAVHPLYGAFLIDPLGLANDDELLQALESVLELPRPLLKFVRVPFEMASGPLAEKLDPDLIARGLMVAK